MPRRTSDDTQRDLLDSASVLFREQGLRATGIADIASAAGYSKATVIYQFGSKDRLIRRWAGPLIDDLAALGDSIEAEADPNARRKVAIDGFIRLCLEHRESVRILQSEIRYVLNQDALDDFNRVSELLQEAIAPSDDEAGHLIALVFIGGISSAFDEVTDLRNEVALSALTESAYRVLNINPTS